jgi:hypothetical protein
VVVLLFFVVVVVWLVVAGGAAGRKLKRQLSLETNGVRGRALVLSSSFLTTGTTLNGVRYEQRTMTLDIDLPGRAPYVTSGQFLVPRGLVEPVPGASLDIAVDPSNPSSLSILGPGGFSGPWIRVGVPAPY